MARVGHSGMTADELMENIEAAVQTVAEKIRMVSAAVLFSDNVHIVYS